MLVSVIMPCHNNADTIISSVQSVVHGSYSDYELLIYDDASTDETVKLLEEYLKISGSRKITLYCGDKNKGAAEARNYLLARAKGEYFAFLDADDTWYKDKLSLQMELIKKYQFDLVTCAYDIADENNVIIGRRNPPKKNSFLKMLMSNWLATSMTIVSSNLISTREMPPLRKRQDYAYWLLIFKLNRRLKYGSLQQSGGCYLKRENSLSASKKENIIYNYRMFRKVMNYSIILSAFLVTMNALVRIFRK